jgi:hypothetical protein
MIPAGPGRTGMRPERLGVLICMSFAAVLFLSVPISNAQDAEGKPAVKQENPEMEKYKAETKEKLDGLDKRIKELQADAKKKIEASKVQINDGLDDLKRQRAELKKRMKRLENSSREEWEAAKQKINNAIEEIEKTFNRVKSYFK